jgi:HD-GYP domain-containing protein (c-di-GMP phosphodiesterase class II)
MVQPPPLPTTPTLKGVPELLMQAEQLLELDPQTATALATKAYRLSVEQADYNNTAEALVMLGLSSEKRADLEPARNYLLQAAKTFEQLQEPGKQQQALAHAGRVSRTLGELDRATTLLEQSLELAEQLGDLKAKADVLNNIAGVLYIRGEYRGALQVMEQVIGVHKRVSNTQGYNVALGNVAALHIKLGNYSQALELQFEVYQSYKVNADTEREASILNNIGYTYEEANDFNKAIEFYNRALSVSCGGKERMIEMMALNNLGSVYNRLGSYQQALKYVSDGLLLSQQYGHRTEETTAWRTVGNIYVSLAQYKSAAEAYRSSLKIAEAVGDSANQLSALMDLAQLHFHLEKFDEALLLLARALRQAEQTNSKKHIYEAHKLFASIYEQLADYPKALEHYKVFHNVEREVFGEENERMARNSTLRFELALEKLDNQIDVFERLAKAAEFRDDDTSEHIKRVGDNAALIAREKGWSKAQVENLRAAAALHDVGKIGISDLLLYKQGKYTDEERELMKAHTTIGAKILAGGRTEQMRMAETIALTHHERWDGKGYPNGLAGEQIPEAGRIVAVADVFDALTSKRPYKEPWPVEKALSELEKSAGTQFDPEVVKIALKVFKMKKAT